MSNISRFWSFFRCCCQELLAHKHIETFPNTLLSCVVVTFCVRRSRGEMCSGHGRLCACLSVCLSVCLSALSAVPHYWTDPDIAWVTVYISCALLDGFAINARISLLWQHSADREMSASVCTRCMSGLAFWQCKCGVAIIILLSMVVDLHCVPKAFLFWLTIALTNVSLFW